MKRDLVWQKFIQSFGPITALLNKLSGGGFDILLRAAKQFVANQPAEAAASIAFYAIFSLFPLLAVVVTGLSFITDEQHILQTLVQFLIPIFPVSQGLISENLRRFIELRSTVGILSAFGIIWSASSVFIILARHLNRAWETARVRDFVQSRLVALAIVGAMLGLVILAQIGSSIADIVLHIDLPWASSVSMLKTFLGTVVSGVLPSAITFVVFLLLYKYIPSTKVRFREAFWGAIVVTGLWEITSNLFSWYIGSGLAQYDLLYGSIATLTVLMFWFYINSLILLFGAYISSAIAQRQLERDAAIPAATVEAGSHEMHERVD